ncbi:MULTISPECIES: 2-hydroxyacid dehydrogenase [Rhizobium]|uniref:D-isomer specific 2-hydroxyacid dehydrogenase NAD-binding n=1 Tax=Rhizobium favelukesii TaxID=348824 RepID=W6S3Y3_9HYPH|nr:MULTISPECIES: 2-hydroxyacid dehydrogenase [Rhizobium]MCS0460653.1 2-hydroxyacid dehydrogenase [Rhizobium favelukesii]UFS85682.1 2-hydroxyacid dehydrogenase [Rhizobium sp. T136]CDM61036.1 D-isomer specific 2-hydroxyacid dehydrogenase NAD-binding [Rhizobium favelukesii]
MFKHITILQAAELPEKTDRELKEAFTVIGLPKGEAEAAGVLAEHGAAIRGMAVRHAHIDARMLEKLPALEIISSYSAGLDGIDVEAAASRGVSIHNTSKILAQDVADLAVALSISATRGLMRGHDFVRNGNWGRQSFPLGRSLRSLNTGIVGLGHIGSAIAARMGAMGAMGAPVAYFGPRRKPVDHLYIDSIDDLAEWADLLIVTCPASPETIGLIGSSVLEKLGPRGFLVNISRGTIVNEPALIAALAKDGIAGAALDVFEKEPVVPDALRNDPRVVLSPHMGSGTQETRQQMGDRLVEALVTHFSAR